MLVYGRNVAKEFLKNNKKVRKIIIQENFNDKEINSLIEKGKFRVEVKSKKEIDDLCSSKHQGIILDVSDFEYSELSDLYDEEIIVVLDHLEDPHNLGAIIRTCEAAGIKSLVIPKNRQVLINSTVMKTSVGTLNNVNIALVSNIANSLDILKKNGFWIVGTTLNNSIDYREIDYNGKIVLVIGNEANGISDIVAKKCDFLAKIPMYGETNSLNASVAAGIMIYEIIRNRK